MKVEMVIDMARLPAIIQPRWTWRYVVGSAVATYAAYCWIFSVPPFAHRLPEYTGPYPVGAIDLEIPLEKPQVVNEARLKETGEHVFKVETVLFTLYYPATTARSPKTKHYWIPKPISLTAEGYTRFAKINNYVTNTIFTGLLGILIGGITIPATVDAPLATSETQHFPNAHHQQMLAGMEGLPVIVFSHGMASSRTDYTHYLGELASRGHVIAAIEHRDGSSPGSFVSSYPGGITKSILHFSLNDIISEPKMKMSNFKEAQLAFRQVEIEETVRVLKLINAGHGKHIHSLKSRGEGNDLPNWINQLDTSHMIIAGHSYGATGTLGLLRSAPSETLPFHAAIALDPGKNSGPLNSDINIPTLIMHSNSWSSSHSIFMGRPHFDVIRDIARGINARGIPSWFMTSLGTSHPSVTDAPLIEPLLLSWTTGARIDAAEGVRQYVHVSNDFVRFVREGTRQGLLTVRPDYPDYGVDNEKTPEKFRKFWQVHVAPPEEVR